MADDIINSGAAENKKTTAQLQEDYAKTSERLNKDYAAASEVMDAAKTEMEHGREQNTEFSNSGLNTTVAKDSKGNAIGTYDWDAQAEHTAKISYNSDVLSAKQDATSAKQELVTNQQQGQVQHDMAGYSANQSAEKAGWTGGYVLDSNRQVAFLKESIKANLYSQEELQKYGYDTALAAARANYDLKKSELAMQNYNTAVQNAFQMAEFTGKFVSPETSFHLSQRGVAEQILKDPNATAEDKAKAEEVISSVNSWFKGNDISEEGVYCMSILMQNYAQASTVVESISNSLANNAEAWDKLNAMLASNQQAVDAANADSANTGMFSYVDEYGSIKKISANYAEAATSGKMPEGLSADAQTAYTAKLGEFISNLVTPQVTSAASGLNFKSEEDARAWVEADLKEKLESINADGATVKSFNITCKVNGNDVTITVGGDTVKDRKNSTASKNSIETNTISSSSDTVLSAEDFNNIYKFINEDGTTNDSPEMLQHLKDNYTFTGFSTSDDNDNINAGGNITISNEDGEKIGPDTYEFDAQYNSSSSFIDTVFKGKTDSNEAKIAKAVIEAMDNSTFAVIPAHKDVIGITGEALSETQKAKDYYIVVYKDSNGNYTFIRDKDVSGNNKINCLGNEDVQKLARAIISKSQTT